MTKTQINKQFKSRTGMIESASITDYIAYTNAIWYTNNLHEFVYQMVNGVVMIDEPQIKAFYKEARDLTPEKFDKLLSKYIKFKKYAPKEYK